MSARIAVINLTRMGDLLMTAPMIGALRRKQPGVDVELVVADGFAAVAEGLGADRVVPLDYDAFTTLAVRAFQRKETSPADLYRAFRRLLAPLRERRYDAVFNLSHTRISAVLANLLHGPVQGGIHLDGEGYRRLPGRWTRAFFAGNLHRQYSQFHLVDINRGMADVLGGGIGPVPMSYRPPEGTEERLRHLLRAEGLERAPRPWVVLQTGASSPEKRWDAASFGEVGARIHRELGATLLLVGTEEEAELARRAVAAAGKGARLLTGKTDVPLLAGLLELADLLVSNDTGTMHLAQAVGTPSLVVTLGSALSDETGPYGEGNLIVEPTIPCFPCSAKQTCTHHACHHQIRPELVARLALARLGSGAPAEVAEQEQGGGAQVWETGFDEYGIWHKRPLAGKIGDSSRLSREIVRNLLVFDLEEPPVSWEVRLEQLAGRLLRLAGEGAAGSLEDVRESVLETLPAIETLAGDCVRICREMEELALRPELNAAKLAERGEELARASEELTRRGTANDATRTLLLLLRFDLENLPEEDLQRQVAASQALYQRLHRLLGEYGRLLEDLVATLPAHASSGHGAAAGRIPAEEPHSPGRDPGYGPAADGLGREENAGSVPRRDHPAGIAVSTGKREPTLHLERFQRPRLRRDRCTVILPVNGYYLQREIATTLRAMGHRVLPLEFEGREDTLESLLTMSLEADLLLTVNHLGFDTDGVLARILRGIGLPWATWYVDRPEFILLDSEIGREGEGLVFTWEKSTIEKIKAYGFEAVEYLPLAADPETMQGPSPESSSPRVCFVGHSMQEPVRDWKERAGIGAEEEPLFQLAVRRQQEGRREPVEVLGQAVEELGLRLDRWDTRRALSFASAVALAATGQLRSRLVQAAEARSLQIQVYGDNGWRRQLPSGAYRGGVDYFDGLAELYRGNIHLNATSYQMPTAVNQRVFDVPLAGGTLVTDDQEALGALFDREREVFTAADPEQMADLAGWLRNNPGKGRERSRRAAERTLNEHTYRHRLTRILDRVRSTAGVAAVPAYGGR